MLKKTKGYFLITMLVLTGLAGRTHTDNLPGKERRFLSNEIKTTQINFINAVKGLTRRQLDYRSGKNALSIKDFLCRITVMQNDLLHNIELPHKKISSLNGNEVALNNNELLNCLNNKADKLQYPCLIANIHTSKEAINNYKKQISQILLYVRTATDNLHHDFIKTRLGNIDIFQTIDLIASYTRQSLNDINKIKSTTDFPK